MLKTLIKLNPADFEILQNLELMVDTVNNDLEKKTIYKNRLTPKQTLVVAMFAPINSYTEGVIELCRQGRADPAIVLVRSMVEAYLNSNYVLSYPTNKNLWLFSLEDSYYRRSYVDIIENFYTRYPYQRKKGFGRKILRKMRKVPEKELKDYKKNLNIFFDNKSDFDSVFGSLLGRAQGVDNRQKKAKKKQAGGMELVYILAYKQLSEYVHLTMRGINHFWKKSPLGDTLVVGINLENINLALVTTYIMYLYFCERLKQYKIINISLSKFQKFYSEKISISDTLNKVKS